MNKFIGLIGVVIVIAGLGWLNRVDLLLMVGGFAVGKKLLLE